MKKEYVKPYLVVESFQLDAAIAGACTDNNRVPINFQIGTCQLENGYFSTNCEGEDIYNREDICYHAFAHDTFITS